MRRLPASLLAGSLLLGSLALAGCTSGDDEPAAAPSHPTSASTSRAPITPVTDGPARSPDDPALDVALSTPVEDSVYPQVGDPGVDALSYDLDLAWTARTRTLTAVETLVFRSTTDADRFQLDLGRALEVSALTVDGEEAAYDHEGKDLVVHTPVSTDRRYTLRLEYAGTPRPVAAPTTRSDFSTSGWTITPHGEVWTMQEPYGAYSWYAVNDQPADKALYSFTISAPSPMAGVANGRLVSRQERDGTTVTRWELEEPAASYLVTIAIAELRMTRDRSPSGVPITYWTPPDARFALRGLRTTPRALDWVENLLGPYPFSTLGIVLVSSRSGMETQTMITLGATDYTTAPEVIVHELVHQWYGDQVTPNDWRDVWMNEGMALYLQGMWEAERSGQPLDSLMDEWASREPQMRFEAGPPGAYDPSTFGESNIYFGPALMWHELRRRLGDEKFWSIVRAWPQAHDNGNAGRRSFVDWLNREAGQDLTDFYDAWLLDPTQPSRSAG